jgi:hypothetical protein
MVDVCVHLDVQTAAAASQRFLDLNHSKAPTSHDKFNNRLKALDPIALGVVKCANEHGIEISRTGADGHLCCVSTASDIYAIDGGYTLSNTLEIIVSAWGTGEATLEGKIIEGISLILGSYDGAINKSVLVKKLAKFQGGPSCLLGLAKGDTGHSGRLSCCVANRVLDAYNSGRRSELARL